MDDTWTDLASPELSQQKQQRPMTPSQYLLQSGLAKDDVVSIIEKLGAVTMDDLALVDSKMANEAVSDLKIIPKKKALNSLAAIQRLANENTGGTILDSHKVGTITQKNKDDTDSSSQVFTEECVVICIDHSGSMGTCFNEQKSWCDDGNQNALSKIIEQRSRMDAVKQVFYAFRDRTETLGTGKHKLGLIKFDDKIEKILDLTYNLDTFEAVVDNLSKRGATAIYSSVVEACKMLFPIFQQSPQTDLRIVVLTDGQNNYGVTPESALEEVNKIGAVVDAIIVGDTPDDNLLKIVSASKGSCFQIRTLSEGFELMESEAVVSLRARRGGTDKPKFTAMPKISEVEFSSMKAKEIVSGSSAGKVIVSNNQAIAKKVVELGAMVTAGEKSPTKFQGHTNRRIMKELRQISYDNSGGWIHSGEGIHIFIDSDNISLMKALIEGPRNTPFEDGVFVLNIKIPSDYPFKPPKILFETPVYHCNVSDIGEICLDILKTNWSPALSIPKAIEAVRMMLSNPNSDNALRQWIAELTIAHNQSGGADTRYVDGGKASTRQFASRSILDWKKLWGVASE